MRPPFTHDQFLAVFAEYNRALWPVVILIWLVTALALWRLHRGFRGSSRLLAGVLAFQWAWSGVAYHLVFFRRINPAAVAFGTLFVIEAGLLLWRGVARDQLVFQPRSTRWSAIGLVLALYAMAYPGIGLALGLAVPAFPSFAVPCPATILTAGVLLMAPRPEARLLGIVPVLWAAIGGSAAFLLGIRADFALPVAGAVLVAFMIGKGRDR